MTQISVQSLLGMSSAGVGIIVGSVCFIVALVLGYFICKILDKTRIAKNRVTAQNILQDALNEAKQVKKEALLESKEETQRLKDECETELKERRNELLRLETRIVQREDFIQKKEEQLDKKSDLLDAAKNDLKVKEDELNNLIEFQNQKPNLFLDMKKMQRKKQQL